jgi:hypothetical protein
VPPGVTWPSAGASCTFAAAKRMSTSGVISGDDVQRRQPVVVLVHFGEQHRAPAGGQITL